jgi:hypothetical protein
MKKTLLVALLIATTCFGSFAQDKKAEIKKLFDLMSSEKIMAQAMNNIMNVMKQQMASNIQGNDAKAKMDKMSAYLTEETTTMLKSMINEDMVGLYDKHFTEAEIKDFIAFYQSPSGQKFLTETPALTGELMGILMQKYMPAFRERMKAKMEELK